LQSGANVGGYGLFESYAVRPTYYTYQMYKGFGDELALAASDTPKVSLYAARKGDALTLMIVNLNDQAVARPLVLDHFSPRGPAQAKLFDKDHKATNQPDVVIGGKTDYVVPPLSITLLTIPGQVMQP
jgi:TfoX/Sxy family transcriptional regulator of competence genes